MKLINVPCLHHAGLCPKGGEPDLVITLSVAYLDAIESPLDDGGPQSASSTPPFANLAA